MKQFINMCGLCACQRMQYCHLRVFRIYFAAMASGKEVRRRMVEQINLGDVVLTRKPHPCGGNEWTVTRTGADIKIRCNTCGRVVMLDRERFLRQRKTLVRPGQSPDLQKTEAEQ